MTQFKLRRPCPKCPFRTDVPGFLRRERAQEIAEGIARGSTFACHQTTEYVEEWEGDGGDLVETDVSQMCAGALIVMERQQAPNQIVRVAERLGLYDAAKLDLNAPVVRSLVEFVERHGDEDEQECCWVVNAGCLAPAGVLIDGLAVPAEAEGETHECPACGEPVCDACSGEDGRCYYCAERET